MKSIGQSFAALFLVTAIGLVMCPSSMAFDVRELLRIIQVTESDRIGKPVANFVERLSRTGERKTVGGNVQSAAPTEGDVVAERFHAAANETDSTHQHELLTSERMLTEAITQVVAADTWEANGTGNGALTCVGNVLIVVSSEKVAEEVRDFVTGLEFKMKHLKK